MYKDERGIILPVLDDDIVGILEAKATDPTSRPEEEFLRKRIRQVALSQ